MRFLAAAFGIAGTVAAVRSFGPTSTPVTLIVTGDTDGYLSPCGCSEPMTGGTRRQATVIRKLESQPNVLVVNTGDLVAPRANIGRQDQLKAETLAQSFGNLGIKAVNLTVGDARLGYGQLISLSRNMSDSLITASIENGEALQFAPSVEANGVTVTGVSSSPERLASQVGARPVSINRAIGDLIAKTGLDRPIVVMLDGDKDAAAALARRFPTLTAITYRFTGDPPKTEERVGSTLLVTPGERGQFVVSVSLGGSDQGYYRVIPLGPDVHDDPAVSRYFREYLRQVSEEHLWEKTARSDGPRFVGSARCGSCHQESLQVWERSAHSHALKTLAAKGQNRDPECLPCHITGSDYLSGFTSPGKTPQLAFVGCESCHGAGAGHSARPRITRMEKVLPKRCDSCHQPLNSPKFNFARYWLRIKHGR